MEAFFIHLQILSPEKTLFEGEVNMITLPGTSGSFTVLPNHAALISSLQKGVITFETDALDENVDESDHHSLPIERGFVEINHNKMTICVEVDMNTR